MSIDGKQIAAEVLARAKARAAQLARPPRVAAIVTSESTATRSYLAIKEKRAQEAGCVLSVVRLSESAGVLELTDAITSANADAVIAQLPLPFGIDTRLVCDEIPPERDADVLSSAARQMFERGQADALVPPVAGAVSEIFKSIGVDPKGKKAAVIGTGWLVGAPCTTWLRQQGADVQGVDITTGPEEFAAALASADIIVSGAGSPGLIKPEMIKEGAVLIDAGTSELGGRVVGDADPTCAAKCALFTPVPGGVGPIAVAYLFANAVTLAERER